VHIPFIGCHSVDYVPSKRQGTAQQQTHDRVNDLTKSSVQCLRIVSNLSSSGCSSIGNAGIEPGAVLIITLHLRNCLRVAWALLEVSERQGAIAEPRNSSSISEDSHSRWHFECYEFWKKSQ